MLNSSPLRQLILFLKRPQTGALGDQAIVSGTNFLTTVLIGRACSQEDLGLYSLGFTFLIVLSSLQESLVNAPYAVFGNRLKDEPRKRLAGSVWVHHLFLLLILSLLLGITGLGSSLADGRKIAWLLWVLALTLPFVLIREFWRRIQFAHLSMTNAWIMSACASVVQLSILIVLIGLDWINPFTAHLAVGAACLLVGIPALWFSRHLLSPCREQIWSDLRSNWKFGRWLMATQMVGVVHGFVSYWILAGIKGTEATGAFAACMTIVMLSNPLILGMANYLGPQSSRSFAEGGRSAVRTTVLKSTILLTGAMSLFVLFILLFGSQILTIIYGPQYAEHSTTIHILAFAVLVGAMGIATEHGLRAMERSDTSFLSGLCGFAVTITGGSLAIPHWGVVGAAIGYLLGSTTSSTIRAIVFFRELRHGSTEELSIPSPVRN